MKLVDMDNNSRLSNIVMIKSDKPVVLGIDGIFPNPANSVVNLNVQAPASDNITAVVTDISGKVLITHNAHVEAGSNTVQLDVSRLVSGTYLVKLICKANCESVVGKFVKQ
ncbi:MAG: T9SS type A sorting domain-containing protein [Chitinophagaceae bacterium]|nr:T9SS type A sorting domain-containing protein [Chitinophagaceae bacterium]